MSRIVILVSMLVGAAFARGADSTLLAARRAQAELGSEIWSEVLRIENAATESRYPRTFHVLVFELVDILWIYTAVDGTQSLSLRRGHLAEEKADLAPLLRAIDPGFVRWRVLPDGAPSSVRPDGELPNGCFIESVAALRVRCERGEVPIRSQLLSYYVDTAEGRRGHTVLTFIAADRLEVIDPSEARDARRFSHMKAASAIDLARALIGEQVVKARWLPLDQPAPTGGFFASNAAGAGGDPGDATIWQQ